METEESLPFFLSFLTVSRETNSVKIQFFRFYISTVYLSETNREWMINLREMKSVWRKMKNKEWTSLSYIFKVKKQYEMVQLLIGFN